MIELLFAVLLVLISAFLIGRQFRGQRLQNDLRPGQEKRDAGTQLLRAYMELSYEQKHQLFEKYGRRLIEQQAKLDEQSIEQLKRWEGVRQRNRELWDKQQTEWRKALEQLTEEGEEESSRGRYEISGLLANLRNQAFAVPKRLTAAQLDAHWSFAYACGSAPEAWEIYRVAALHLMPCTKFFSAHESEVTEELKAVARVELLHGHATEVLRFYSKLTDDEKEYASSCGGFGRKVQFYDAKMMGWSTADVPAIPWFFGDESARNSLEQPRSDEEIRRRAGRPVKRRMERDPGFAQKVNRAGGVERWTDRICQIQIEIRDDPSYRSYLAKVATTKDFRKTLFEILRAAENRVRAALGIAAVGEGWVSETELLNRVRSLLPGHKIVAHGQPPWLGRQHLDIWLPDLMVGVEYQGVQHFEPVELFGGRGAFERNQERDARKRRLCAKHGVRLVEVAYDQTLNDVELVSRILGTRPEA